MMKPIRMVVLLASIVCSPFVAAEIPESYKPAVIKPPFSMSERLIDLTPVLEKAKSEGKPILLYMGAQDCPPCRQYEQFLSHHQSELAAVYAPWMVVDVRSWLKGPKLIFRAGDKRYTLDEFKAVIGDKNKVFTWPYWWAITPELRQIRQFPQGSKHFLDVENQKVLLRVGKS